MPSGVDEAMAALARLEQADGVFTEAAAGAGQVTVVAEIASESDKWARGADVELELTDAGGHTVGTTHGQIASGARSVLLALPVESTAGPWRAKVVLRAQEGFGHDPCANQCRANGHSG